jgi:hypothetical protein
MRTMTYRQSGHGRAAAGLMLALVLAAWPSPARSQSVFGFGEDGMIPRDFGAGNAVFPNSAPPALVRQRIRIFRFTPGFLSDQVGLQDIDDSPPGLSSSTPSPPAEAESGPDWIQVAMGTDNPYFDFRQPGDPGGVGFYRVNTQIQFLDTIRTACTFGIQAVSPAGIQYNGVQDGPTVLSPQLGLFHALDSDTALQGFVGKHMLVSNSGPAAPIQRNLQYGMAVQRSLAAIGPEPLRNVYLYMGALGQYRPERNESSGAMAVWRMLPGVHWKVTDNWWLSGGLLLPIGPARADTPTSLPWQLTCSFQF